MADGRETGSIVFVEDLPEASSLVGDHASGATVLSVADGRVFGEAGVCRVADVDYDYERLDDSLTVSPGLVAAVSDGEPVARVGPEGQVEARKVVHLDFDGDSDVDSEAEVRSSDRGYFPDGDALAGAEVDVVDTAYGYETLTRPYEQPTLDPALLNLEALSLTARIVRTENAPANRVEIMSDGALGKVSFYSGDPDETFPASINAVDPGIGPPEFSMISGVTAAEPFHASIGLVSGATAADRRVFVPNLFITAAPTTGGAANVNIGPGGQLRESTSSERFKSDIKPTTIAPDAVRRIVTSTWLDNDELERDPDTTNRYIGVTAEHLHALGLGIFVTYDEEGPRAVQYDRLFVAVLALAQQNADRADLAEQRLARIEAVLNLPKIGA